MNMKRSSFLFSLLFLLTISFVCVPSLDADIDFYGEYDEETWEEDSSLTIEDPYENFNRAMFSFNDKAHDYVLSPIGKGYDIIIPKKIQSSIDNFFTNIRMPVRFFNSIFQGKGGGAGREFGRFLINSTVGIGGFFDPATAHFNIAAQDEDFGQTLGFHGMETGPYLVWPLFGPSSKRDTIGFVMDLPFSPLFWFGILDVEPEDVFFGANVLRHVNNYSYKVKKNYNSIRKSALDPYTSVQHAYIQIRTKKIDQ